LLTTLIYTHIVSFNSENEFYFATVRIVVEVAKLLEQGVDCAIDVGGVRLINKRK
jgi:hypothetical protein